MKNLEKFLEELTALSRKHGLIIVQGCCNEPGVMEVDEVPVYEVRPGGSHLRVRPLQKVLN